MMDSDRWYRSLIAGMLCMALALLLAILVAWAGYAIVVIVFKQEEITFWVTIVIAVLVWFLEQMLHLTLPCRRLLRRLANHFATVWLDHRNRASQRPE